MLLASSRRCCHGQKHPQHREAEQLAKQHGFLGGGETSMGGIKALKVLATWVMPVSPSCSILLQPCWFG